MVLKWLKANALSQYCDMFVVNGIDEQEVVVPVDRQTDRRTDRQTLPLKHKRARAYTHKHTQHTPMEVALQLPLKRIPAST